MALRLCRDGKEHRCSFDAAHPCGVSAKGGCFVESLRRLKRGPCCLLHLAIGFQKRQLFLSETVGISFLAVFWTGRRQVRPPAAQARPGTNAGFAESGGKDGQTFQ